MASLSLIALIGIGAIGLVVAIFNSLASAVKAERQRAALAAEHAKQKKLEDRRRTEQAIKIVGEKAPELAALRQAVTVLRDYVASANAYRPKFITHPSDISFR